MSGVTVVDHPVLAHRVAQLRDRTTDGDTFRQLVSEVSGLLAYEAIRDLGTTQVTVDTPVAEAAPGVGWPRSSSSCRSSRRARHGAGDPGDRAVDRGGPRRPPPGRGHVAVRGVPEPLPGDLGGRRVIVCDPMLATGGSLGQVCELVVPRGAAEVIALCILASEPGLAAFGATIPGCRSTALRSTPVLNDNGLHRAGARRRRGPALRAARLTPVGYSPMSSCHSSGLAAMKPPRSSVHSASSSRTTRQPCSATQVWPPRRCAPRRSPRCRCRIGGASPLQYQQGESVVTITQSA